MRALLASRTQMHQMSNKRPQQNHKDLLATDFKNRTDDEHIHEEDKQALHTRRGKLAAVEKGANPALAKLKDRQRGRGAKE